MALPVALAGRYLPTVSSRNVGPYISSAGNVYVICLSGPTPSDDLSAMKATDPETSFTEADTIIVAGWMRSLATVQEGDIIHCVFQIISTNVLQYCQFNMADDTFSGLVTVFTPTSLGTYGVDIDVRSNGDLIVLHTGNNPTTREIAYSRREGTTWTAGIVVYTGSIGRNAEEPSVVVGPSDQAFFMWWVALDANTSVRLRALSSANVLRTTRTLTSPNVQDRTRMGSARFTRGATDYITFTSEENTNKHYQHRFTDFSDDTNPTLTVDTIDSAAVVGNPKFESVHMVDVDETNQPVYHLVNDGAAVTVAVRSDGGVNGAFSQVAANMLNSTPAIIYAMSANIFERANNVVIGLVYEDDVNLKYDEYVIRSLAVTGTGALDVGIISLSGDGLALPVWGLAPDADASIGSWTNELGGTTNIYQSADEVSANDADYIKSSDDPVADICKLRLSNPGGTVDVAEIHRISYRYRKDGFPEIDLVVRLIQGASTVIATWTHTTVSPEYTTVTQTLTGPQIALITDYDDLFLEFQADAQ